MMCNKDYSLSTWTAHLDGAGSFQLVAAAKAKISPPLRKHSWGFCPTVHVLRPFLKRVRPYALRPVVFHDL